MQGMVQESQGVDAISQKERQEISRRNFLKLLGGLALGTAAMGAGGWTYVTRIEPDWVDIVPVTLTLPRLAPAFSGFRLVQFSDIHLSDAFTLQETEEACRRVLEQKPDLVVITGDYVDDRRTLRKQIGDLGRIFQQLAQQAPVAAILGNHDYRMGVIPIKQMLVDAGIRLLINEHWALERGGARLHIAGLDDVLKGRPRLMDLAAQIPTGEAAILLAHEPDYADQSAQTGCFDLQLSGHSHGGQVVLPLVGPPLLPDLGQRYPSGRYQVNDMVQYTNRGLGTTSPHVRLNCRPEITVFTLQSGYSRS